MAMKPLLLTDCRVLGHVLGSFMKWPSVVHLVWFNMWLCNRVLIVNFPLLKDFVYIYFCQLQFCCYGNCLNELCSFPGIPKILNDFLLGNFHILI